MWLLRSSLVAASYLFLSSVDGYLNLPAPNGSFGVALAIQEVINNDLNDPYASNGQKRRIMLSAFFPTVPVEDCQKIEAPYMPAFTASVYDQLYATEGIVNGTFEAFQLSLCEQNGSMSADEPYLHFPVILFSPGLGNSRLIYSAVAESLAAQGFVVITIDHPFDAAIVEFPDGSYILAANITTPDQIEMDLDIRTKDVTFVIDQLYNSTFIETLLTGLYGSVNLKALFIAGHSLGGATAASAMLDDKRLINGVNLDGTFFGPVVQQGLQRAFMMLAHEGKNQSTDSSWADIWPHLQGSKVQASVEGTVHASYTDFPLLVDVLELRDSLPADQVAELVGSIPGERMLDIVASSIQDFFCLIRTRPQLFEQSLANITEVEIANITIRRMNSWHDLSSLCEQLD